MSVTFRDAPYAPQLLFLRAKEGLGHAFYIGRFAVTFDEFDCFCRQTGRAAKEDEDRGRQSNPAIHVSWDEAQAYVLWLSALQLQLDVAGWATELQAEHDAKPSARGAAIGFL